MLNTSTQTMQIVMCLVFFQKEIGTLALPVKPRSHWEQILLVFILTLVAERTRSSFSSQEPA